MSNTHMNVLLPNQTSMLAKRMQHYNIKSSETVSPPGPFDEVWQMVEQVECVIRISGNLCHSPHNQEQDYTFFILDLQQNLQVIVH